MGHLAGEVGTGDQSHRWVLDSGRLQAAAFAETVRAVVLRWARVVFGALEELCRRSVHQFGVDTGLETSLPGTVWE